MSDAKSSFIYVIYIRTTPEKLWAALTTPETVRQCWFGASFDTDWKAGSKWKLAFADGRVADSGTILEIDPPKRMVLEWQNQWSPELNAEGVARCTYAIEAVDGGAVKLTILHEINKPGSKFIEAVSGGWPRILSNVKSMLETGDVVMKAKN